MTQSTHYPAERFSIQVGRTQLAGERSGQGQPLIFLHAGVADRRMWRPQMAALGDRFQTAAYDRRGFGETTAADEPFSHVEDLRAVLDQLAFPAAALIGSSQGGRLAIDFALTYPERVTALFLIAPAISGAPQPESFPQQVEALFEALDEAEEADDLERVNEIEAHMWLDGPGAAAGRVTGSVRDLFLDMNGIALQAPEFELEAEPAAAYDRAADLSLPLFVAWGDLDFPHIKERCRYLVESVPAAQGLEIATVAHLPNLERPQLISDLIRSFLA